MENEDYRISWERERERERERKEEGDLWNKKVLMFKV